MSDRDTAHPPKTRRLSFWLLLFSVSFLVSLGLCGISLKTNDEGGLAVFSLVGMAGSLICFVLCLIVWAVHGIFSKN